jgi:hypothetical protein
VNGVSMPSVGCSTVSPDCVVALIVPGIDEVTFTNCIGSCPTDPTPSITTTSLASGQVGIPYLQTLTATGGLMPYTWSLTSGTLPAGLTLGAPGVISGTPTAAVTAAPLTFQVADASNPPVTATVFLTITITAQQTTTPLTITNTALASGAVGTAYSQTLTASGGTSPYTWQLTSGTLPAGLTLNASTGTIGGTPSAAAAATPLTFKVTDSGTPQQSATSALTLTLTITTTVGPLKITTAALNGGVVGTGYSQPLTATGGTGPYAWQVSGGRLPPGLTLNPATGQINGTPQAAVGTVLTFLVTDASTPPQTASATFTLTVTLTPTGLTIVTTSLSNDAVGVPYSQTLTATGGTGPYAWQLISGTLPAGLTLNASTGVVGGTPTALVTATPLTFQVTDSSTPPQTADASLTLTIATQQTTPLTITTTALNSGVVGTEYSQTLTATSGTGPYTWRLTAGRLPSGFTLNPTTGAISGMPTSLIGTLLTLQVTDSGNPQQTATAALALTIVSTP